MATAVEYKAPIAILCIVVAPNISGAALTKAYKAKAGTKYRLTFAHWLILAKIIKDIASIIKCISLSLFWFATIIKYISILANTE